MEISLTRRRRCSLWTIWVDGWKLSCFKTRTKQQRWAEGRPLVDLPRKQRDMRSTAHTTTSVQWFLPICTDDVERVSEHETLIWSKRLNQQNVRWDVWVASFCLTYIHSSELAAWRSYRAADWTSIWLPPADCVQTKSLHSQRESVLQQPAVFTQTHSAEWWCQTEEFGRSTSPCWVNINKSSSRMFTPHHDHHEPLPAGEVRPTESTVIQVSAGLWPRLSSLAQKSFWDGGIRLIWSHFGISGRWWIFSRFRSSEDQYGKLKVLVIRWHQTETLLWFYRKGTTKGLKKMPPSFTYNCTYWGIS